VDLERGDYQRVAEVFDRYADLDVDLSMRR
jgi:hypothetical protein